MNKKNDAVPRVLPFRDRKRCLTLVGVSEGGCGGQVVHCGRCTLPGPGKIWEDFLEEARMNLRTEEGVKVSRQMLWGSKPWRLEVPTPEPGAE